MPNYPKDQQLKPVTFSDFSPGIVQRTGVLGATQYSPAKIGAASPTNTYRCIALPGGGLGPLPKRTSDLKFTDLSGPALVPGVTVLVTGLFVFGPLYNFALLASSDFPPINPSIAYEVHVAIEYVNAGTQTHEWRRYPYFKASTSDLVRTDSLAAPSNVFAPTYFTSLRAIPGGVGEGSPLIASSWGPCEPNETLGAQYSLVFPDPATPGTFSTFDPFGGASNGGPIFGHQSRIVELDRRLYLHADPEAAMPLNEEIIYTLPNDVNFDAVAIFGQEFPVGYGAWGSLSSSDLLLIKHTGGAYLVQGDMNSPIVRRFPGVTSTAGIETVGSSTPMGFAYGVNNDGIYVWQGGDSSVNISPQLEPGFWQCTYPIPLQSFRGQFASWGDWLVCPNNYLYDINSQSWWRLEDQSSKTYHIWHKQPMNNTLIGGVVSATSVDEIYGSIFDRAVPAVNYSWQSQPFSPDQRRRVRTRAVSIVAQGSGTVTVTIVPTDSGEATPIQPNAYTINTSGAVRQTANAQTAGTEFILRIVSDGGSNPAPIVHEVSIDFEALSIPTMAS